MPVHEYEAKKLCTATDFITAVEAYAARISDPTIAIEQGIPVEVCSPKILLNLSLSSSRFQ